MSAGVAPCRLPTVHRGPDHLDRDVGAALVQRNLVRAAQEAHVVERLVQRRARWKGLGERLIQGASHVGLAEGADRPAGGEAVPRSLAGEVGIAAVRARRADAGEPLIEDAGDVRPGRDHGQIALGRQDEGGGGRPRSPAGEIGQRAAPSEAGRLAEDEKGVTPASAMIARVRSMRSSSRACEIRSMPRYLMPEVMRPRT